MIAFCAAIVNAQGPSITPVVYRGAFAPAPTAMWTNTWTNWDPENANYGNGVDSIIKTPITSPRTLSGTKKYLLQGLIYVTNNATLTIQAGCIIKGNSDVANSTLIITRGAKINAVGTLTKPIVFTSSNDIGSRNKGDWGGIILLGKAHYNGAGGQNFIEGIAPTANTQYGGGANPDDNDSSGVLKYVRIEFGGYIFAPNQEINGLTLGSVGRKTIIDYVQVSFANDDAFEWFGGTVNCKHLVAYRNLDDSWDTDFGYSGSVQFGLGIRDPKISDNPAVSTSEGFESDNDPVGGNAKPFTSALFSNITEIGPLRGDTSGVGVTAVGFRRAARLRRNSHLRVINSILMDHFTGIFIDGAACAGLANGLYVSSTPNNSPGNLVFKNNIVAGNKAGKVLETNTVWNMAAWFGANKNDSLVSTTGILVNPYDFLVGDYRPATNSPALKNYNFNDSAFYHIDTTGSLATLIACPASVPAITSITGQAYVCPFVSSGDSAKYYVTKNNAGIVKYNWTVPTGATIVSGTGSDTIWVKYDNTFTAGNISVNLVSYCGVSGAAKVLAVKTVSPTPTSCKGPLVSCPIVGTPVTYTTTPIAGITTYLWTVPTGATINGSNAGSSVNVTFNSAVTGNVSVRTVTACGQSAAKVLYVSAVAKVQSVSGTTIACPSDVVEYVANDTLNGGGTTYSWTVPAGATFTGQNNDTITVTYGPGFTGGNITVKAKNCAKTSSVVTLPIALGTCFAKPAGKSIVSELASETVSSIFPNPTVNEFTVSIKANVQDKPTTIFITNAYGQVVKQKVVANQTGTTNVKFSNLNLPSGIYFVKYNVGASTVVKKVVIK